jgi:hypothetical protein
MHWHVSTRTCPALDLVSDAKAYQLEGKKWGAKRPMQTAVTWALSDVRCVAGSPTTQRNTSPMINVRPRCSGWLSLTAQDS